MPTRTGLLQAGDKFKFVKSGRVHRVIARLGNGRSYSVRTVPVDDTWKLYGKPYIIVTEIDYYLDRKEAVLLP